MGACCCTLAASNEGAAVPAMIRDENGNIATVMVIRDGRGGVRSVLPMNAAQAQSATDGATGYNLPPPRPDPQSPDPMCNEIIREARMMKHDVLFKALKMVKANSEGWNKRSYYIATAASEWDLKAPASFDRCPDTADGNLLKGVYYIHRAWDIRGSDLAHEVKSSAWSPFRRCIELARDALLRSAHQYPADPTPWANLCGAVAKGLQVENAQKEAWFREAINRDPLNMGAHSGKLSNLCRKWGGSHEEMHAFARETVGKAPRGSYIKTIQYSAFYEQWLDFYRILQDKNAARKFTFDPEVKEISMALYEEVIEHDHVKDVSSISPHVCAAEWLLILGAKE